MSSTQRFKYGRKNQYRRWVWNRISESVANAAKRPADCIVLYLAGESDLDRPLALARGFKRNNMIAVERDPRIVSVLRSNGVLCIRGNLLEVYRCLAPQIDVLVADTCCGMTFDMTALGAFLGCGKKGAVVAVNMLRGREASTELVLPKSLFSSTSTRHRGELFFAQYVWSTMYAAMVIATGGVPDTFDDWIKREVARHVGKVQTYTYLSDSRTQYFDSAVFRTFHQYGDEQECATLTKSVPIDVRRRCAAILAHRTRRECAQ